MRLNNLSRYPLLAVASMLLIAHSAQAASVDIPLTITVTAPPCEVDVPPLVYLGSISYGEKKYWPLTISVKCTQPHTSEIYAQTLGALVAGTTDTTEMVGDDTLAHFSLEENGVKIPLNGDNGNYGSGFCLGDNNRSCTVTPKTEVAMGAKEGERSAVIRFNLRFKT